MYYSKTTLIGKIIKPGGWPEAVRMKTAPNGNTTTTFMLSVKTQVGAYEHDDWHYVVTFNELAELCKEKLSDGDEVLVEGRFRKRKAGAEGNETDRWELIAEMVKFEDILWRNPPKREKTFRGGQRSENW